MFRYKTLAKEAEAEQVIDRSRFIAHAAPVYSREEAESVLSSVRAAQKQASHNVPAFILGEKSELQWCSDDGEPQGTSGAPVLQMLDREGLTNLIVVVTRYYGGIKLGTGGIVRAYTSSAKLAVEAAGIHMVSDRSFLTVQMEYPFLGKLQNLEKEGTFSIGSTQFTNVITTEISCAPEECDVVKAMLSELTGGSFILLNERQELI